MNCRIAIAALAVMAFASTAGAQVVTKVPSGDTLVVSGLGKVRLAGIRSADESTLRLGTAAPPQPRHDPSTPPSPAVSGRISLKPDRSSRTFLQKLALGQTVDVQFDVLSDAEASRRAYVFLQDGTFVNAEMLRTGHASLDASHAFQREQEFRQLEAEARREGMGIWAGVSSPR